MTLSSHGNLVCGAGKIFARIPPFDSHAEFFRGENVKYNTDRMHEGVRGLASTFPTPMALVSITEAAKLVRRNRSTIYRDIEKGRLSKTVTPDGETQIDTSELLRAYGSLYTGEEGEPGDDQTRDKVKIALLEERTRSLERALALEAELRKVKDQVTNELRARIADKESVIKVLESKVLFLEYDKHLDTHSEDQTMLPPESALNEPPQPRSDSPPPRPKQRWWKAIIEKRKRTPPRK